MRKTIESVLLVVATVGVWSCATDPIVSSRQHAERAKAYAAAGKGREAILEYRRAIQIDSNYGQARLDLADAYVRAGDAQAAFGEYVRAADILSDDDAAQLKAGEVLLLAGRFEDAGARAVRVLAREPDHVAALILLANARAGLRDLKGAIEAVGLAIEADPNRGLSYVTLGSFELMRGNRDLAEAAYQRAIRVDPSSADALMAYGNYRLGIGDRESGEAALERAAELAPENPLPRRALVGLYLAEGAHDKAERQLETLAALSGDVATRLMLADVRIALGTTVGGRVSPAAGEPSLGGRDFSPAAWPSGWTERARADLQRLAANPSAFAPAKVRLSALDYLDGRPADAHRHLDDVLRADAHQREALVLRGRFLLREQRVTDAVERLEGAVAASPTYASGHYWLGTAYAVNRQPERARRAFAEAVRLSPSYADAHVALSQLYRKSGRADEAVAAAKQALTAAPSSLEARVALAWALIGRRDAQRAEDEVRHLQVNRPTSPMVLALEGAVAMLRRDPKTARQAYARALAMQPELHEALSGVLAAGIASGSVGQATADADAAVRRAPQDSRTLVLAARTHLAAREFGKAEQLLRQAIEADAQAIEAYSLLGQLYFEQNRLGEALWEFESAARRQPDNGATQTMVGILLQMAGRRTEAKARYQRALAVDSRAAVAANNLAWLQLEDGDNLDVALHLAQTARARLPESPAVSDTLGAIYDRKGLHAHAIDAFKHSVQRAPGNAVYHYRLGMTYVKRGDAERAREALRKALSLDPRFDGADEARAALASLG